MKYLCFLTMVCLMASCNSPEKLICRTWSMKDIQLQNPSNTFEEAVQKQLKEKAGSYNIVFKKDSIYEIVTKDNDIKGKWWFSPDKKGFHSESAGLKAESKIVELSHSKLVFNATDENGKKMTVSCVPATSKK